MSKLLFFVLLLFLGISCQNISDKNLENKINSEIKETQSINFSKYNDFQWDYVILLPPYTDIQELEKRTELDLSKLDKNIESLDTIYLLVFIEGKKAVKSVEIDRNLGEFDAKYQILIPKKENMVWEIRR